MKCSKEWLINNCELLMASHSVIKQNKEIQLADSIWKKLSARRLNRNK